MGTSKSDIYQIGLEQLKVIIAENLGIPADDEMEIEKVEVDESEGQDGRYQKMIFSGIKVTHKSKSVIIKTEDLPSKGKAYDFDTIKLEEPKHKIGGKSPLLVPRYEVIADYPNCPYNIGHILERMDNGSFNCKSALASICVANPNKFPSNFRLMKWWEKRELSELPKYVYQSPLPLWVDDWMTDPFDQTLLRFRTSHGEVIRNLSDVIPLTPEEFDFYND